MAKKFEAPANLQELDAAALEAAVNDAYAASEALLAIDEAEVTDEQLAELSAISDFVTAANEENTAREQAAAARAEQLAALRANLTPAEEAPAEDETPAEEDAPAEEEDAPAEQPKVAASIQRPANLKRGSVAARAAKNAPKDDPAPAPKPASGKVVAAQDVPGYASGQTFENFSQAAGAILSKLNTLPAGYVADTYQRGTALQIQLPENEFSTASSKYKGKDITELINDASKEANLPGGSLVAAGGWGAPSERSLDFCEIESLDGLISTPEVTITRGGIEWTRGPNFGDVVNSSTGFWDMTETVAEAGTELKTSIRPEVPDFEEARLDAVGVMMENGLLLRQGWPELVERWAKLTLMAHQYKLAQKKVNQIRTLSGAATDMTRGFGNALDIFHIIEMLANGERQRLLLSPSQTLEALIPWWVKSVIRIDLANRSGVADFRSITDAQIESEFTLRNIKVQWLKAFQDIALDATTGLALAYPGSVEIIFYPAGSFVAGVAPVISLDTIYDSTNLKKNDYVHLFVEQGVLMTNPCNRGNRVTIPLEANGRRAANDITRSFGDAIV
ncbi:major head protein [Arthrobacter phage SilentRX]|uniref:Major capsid hexamer protein n=1 Tax=Arthrobacter phage SilentRX TaxID=2836091 RepID=A0A8F3IPL3_9CAUD|nr:major head protein [Arthrobacter phage SilentRX]QWY82762.1 major capsid hexamer protein [Arthrobacter phage SilentRX]